MKQKNSTTVSTFKKIINIRLSVALWQISQGGSELILSIPMAAAISAEIHT